LLAAKADEKKRPSGEKEKTTSSSPEPKYKQMELNRDEIVQDLLRVMQI
jgi:hypothetical protein